MRGTPIPRFSSQWLFGGLAAGLALALIIGLLVHYTSTGSAQPKAAGTPVEEATAHLNAAERWFSDFKRMQQNSTRDARLANAAAAMVASDQAAMVEMDRAKRSGADIAALVKRLCDGLEAQNETLVAARQRGSDAVGRMHDRAEAVEASLRTKQRAVKHDLNAAMSW